MTQVFDFEQALKVLQQGQALSGKDGILTLLIKQLTEVALALELDCHLAQDISANRKNGTTSKTIKATSDHFELATPRDRNGSFALWHSFVHLCGSMPSIIKSGKMAVMRVRHVYTVLALDLEGKKRDPGAVSVRQ